MAKYVVSYDLRKQRNYDDLYSALEELAAVRILESDWLVVSGQSAAQLRDALVKHMDGDDGLFVAALTGEAAWTRLLVSHDAAKAKLTG